MHSAVSAALAAALIAGPTVLAFFSGGYFDRPRMIAGILAWSAVLAAVVLAPRVLPRGTGGRIAVAGLAALCIWTALSLLWTPIGERPATTSSACCSTSATSARALSSFAPPG